MSENSKASEAFCPYALVIQYNAEAGDTTESITTGSYSEGYTVNEKDGDGIVETVNKVGTDYTLETNIMSDSIPDGEIEIVCIAFDKAGNASSSSTKTMISNNLPRVSKVWLATDLNQDGYFKKDEFVWYSENNGVEVQNYAYSCLDSSGNGQEIVTLTTKDSRGNQFTVKDKLALTMELLTGGTGDSYKGLSYIAELVDERKFAELVEKNALGPAKGKNVTGSLTDELTVTVENTVSKKGILFNNDTFTSHEGTTPYLQLTLWDKVNISADGDGKYIATVDTKDANGIITSYGNQYTVLNIPVKVDIKDDVAPTGTITPFYWNSSTDNSLYKNSKEKGHIAFIEKHKVETPEVETPEVKKPEVSGTVVFRGKARDDQILNKLTFTFDSGTTAYSTYTASTGKWSSVGDLSENGYNFTVEDVSLGQEGHSARWTLTVDSAKLLANGSRTLKVTATQKKSGELTSTPGDTQTKVGAETGYYAMEVVPYITGIARSGTTNRSRLGRYAVQEGEEVTVSGFNFGTSGTVQVGNNNSASYTCTSDSSAASGATSFTMTVPEKSGGAVVTSGATSSNNNENKNDGHGDAPEGTSNSHRLNYYNREAVAGDSLTTDYTDDRYLSVWALGNYFKGTDGGVELQKPVMTADKSGNLYASWVAQSNSNVMFSYGVGKDTTAIFRCFDQPATSTGVAFDKSSDNKGVNVAFVPEHQGNSGTFSDHAMSSANMVGGMGAISLGSAFLKAEKPLSGLLLKDDNLTAENPSNTLDIANQSPYYNLANYDMWRRLG